MDEGMPIWKLDGKQGPLFRYGGPGAWVGWVASIGHYQPFRVGL